MYTYPIELITGEGLGISNSSKNQIGSILPAKNFGQFGLKIFANISNGNVFIKDRPIKIVESQTPFEIGYIYNSHNEKNPWRLPYKKFLTMPTPPDGPFYAQIILQEEDGHETSYTYDKKYRSYMSPGFGSGKSRLYYDRNLKQWILYNSETQITEHYNQNGFLEKRIDQEGHTIRYEYKDNDLFSITGNSNDRYEINRSGNFVSIMKNKNEVQRYIFDERGRLKQTIVQGQVIITYEYGGNSTEVYSIKQADGTSILLQSSLTNKTSYLLNAKVGNSIDSMKFEYDIDNKIIKITDGAGAKAKVVIDAQNRISQIIRHVGEKDGNPILEITKYNYLATGQLESITHPDSCQDKYEYYQEPILNSTFGLIKSHTLPNGEIITYYYDIGYPSMPISAITHKANAQSDELITQYIYDFNYDKKGNRFLRFEISPTGQITEHRPDERGNIKSTRIYTHLLFDENRKALLKAPMDIDKMLEWMDKKIMEKKAKKENLLEEITLSEFTYDNNGQVLTTVHYANITEEGTGVEDDFLSVEETYRDSEGKPITTSFKQNSNQKNWPETHYIYDNLKRIKETLDALNNKTKVEYNDKDKTITTTLPNERNESSKLNEEGLVSTKDITADTITRETNYKLVGGLPQQIVHADDRVSYPYYDIQKRMVIHVSPDFKVTEHRRDAINRYEQIYTYEKPFDKNKVNPQLKNMPDREMLLHELKKNYINSNLDRSTYKFFDEKGRTRYEVDAEQYITEYRYDVYNNVTHKICYADRLTQDNLNKLTNDTAIELAVIPTKDRTWQNFYNEDGKLIGEQDPAGYLTEYKLDTTGRTVEKILYATPKNDFANVLDLKSARPDAHNDDAHTYKFYDARNQVTAEVDAEGYLTSYTYLPCGLVQQSTRYMQPVNAEWFKNPIKLDLTKWSTSSEDLVKTYEYDEKNREICVNESNGKLTEKTYDVMDNLLSEIVHDRAQLNSLNPDSYRAHQLQYDNFGQVISEANPFIALELAKIDKSGLTPEEKIKAKKLVWETKSTRYTYEKSGLKTQMIDTLGNVTKYFYDNERRLTTTIDPTGAVIESKYNSFHEIESTRKYVTRLSAEQLQALNGGFVTDVLTAALNAITKDDKDNIEKFEYDRRGNLIKRTDAEKYVSEFEYNAFHEKHKEHLPKETKEPNLHITHEYDTRGNPISKTVKSGNLTTIEQFEYNNPHSLCSTIINAENEKTSIEYDKLGRESKTTNPLLDFTETEHDSLGRVKSHTDEMRNTTEHEYNTALRTHTITTPEKEQSVITENVFGEAVSIVDAKQSNLTMSHAPDGQVEETKQSDITISKKTFNTEGLCTDAADGNGVKTEMKYNAAHQLKEIIQDTENQKLSTTLNINAFGSADKITNSNGTITTQEFDKRNLPTLKTHDTEGLKATTQLNHDGLGNLLETTKGKADQPDSYKEKNNYDAIGRITGNIIDPIDALRKNALNIATQKVNDKVGRTVAAVDANENKTFLFYDINGNKRFSVDPMGNVSEWKHDKTGKVISEKIYYNKIKLEGFSENKSIQDLIALTNPNPNDTERLTYYDKNGRERFIIDKLLNDDNSYTGKVTEYTYNNSTKKAKVTTYSKFIDYSNMDNKKTDEIALEVQRNAAPELDRSVRYIYDSLNRERFIVDGEGYVTEKIYDNNNNVISHIQYSNALNSVDKVEKFNDVDFNKLITANVEQDRTVHYIYNALNKPIFTIDAEGGVTRLDYTNTLKVEQECKFADKIDTTNLSYAEIKNKVSSLVIDRTKDRVTSIEYDAVDRIKKITDELNNFETYEYDALGNEISRTDKNNNVWKREYDRANRAYEKINPSRTVTSVEYKDGKLVPTESQMEIKSKYEVNKLGNIESISLAYNTDKARTLINKFDLINNPTGSDFGLIAIDDPNAASSLITRPEVNTAINTTKVYNSNNKLVAEQIENGAWKFYVRDTLGNIAYELEPIENTSALTTSYLCIHRNYSAFNEVEFETTYSIPLTLSADLYKENGITLDTIKNWIVAATEDRHVATVRDRKGKIKKIELDEINYAEINEKNSPDIKQGIPTQEFEYNAFGEKIRSSQKISENKWADYYFWYNKNGMSVAECNPVNTVSISEYDAFNKVTLHTEYADYLSKNPSQDLTFKQLSRLVDNTNKKNRQAKTEYNLRGQKKTETQLHVTRQRLVGVGENRSIEDYEANLEKSYTYTKLGQEESVIYEDGVSKTYKYYDSNGNTIAEVGICFDSLDDNMQPIKLRPLTYYGYDEHGKKVKTQRFYLGVTDEIINPAVLPKATPHADDQVELEYHNKLGLAIYKQDAIGNLRALSYTATKQIARKWHKLTSFSADGQFNQVNIDEDRTTYNLQGKDTSKEIRRNSVTEDNIIKRLNSFGEQTAEDHGTNEWPIFNKYSKNGDLWSTNSEQGVNTVILKDLAGHEILKVITSADQSAPDLKNITEEQVPTLITDQVGFKELEFTLSKRDNLGRMLNKITPPLVQKKISQNIPVQMSVIEKTVGETKKVYLSWLKQTDATFVTDSIKLTVKGNKESRVFPIVNTPDTNYFTIDISDLQTDIYDFEIDYYYITDKTNKATVSKSIGTIQCITSLTDASHNVVCTIADNDNLILNGNLTDVEAVELFQEGRSVARIPLQAPPHQNTLSLSNRRTGHYTVKPVLKNRTYLAESPLLSVISPIASAEPMSKEINCSAEATLVDQTIKLKIVVPDEYKKRSAKLHINYKSDLGKLYTAVWTLDTLTNPDHILEIPYYFHEFLSFDLKLDMGDNKFIQLYKNEQPSDINVTPKTNEDDFSLVGKHADDEDTTKDDYEHVANDGEEKEEPKSSVVVSKVKNDNVDADQVNFKFKSRTFALITPNALPRDAKQISILDVSKDRYAQWTTLPVTNADAGGFTVDVTGLAVGNYPFKATNAEHAHLLTVSKGNQVYSSDSSSTSEDTQQAVNRAFTWDAWNNTSSITDSLGNKTEFEHNDLNKEIKKVEPEVDCVLDNNSIVRQKLTTLTGYNDQGYEFATRDPKGQVQSDTLNQIGASLTKMLGDGTISKKMSYDIFSRIKNYSDAENNIWKRVHDRVGNILSQTSPMQKTTNYLYNEKKQTAQETNPLNESTRYQHDARNNISERTNADGSFVRMTHDRNHRETTNTYKEGTQSWARDAFGHAKNYTNLSGILTEYIYNQAKKLTRQRNNDVNRRKWAKLMFDHYDMHGQSIDAAYLKFMAVMGQDIEYKYTQSHLLEMRDRSGLQLMRFKLNTEGNRIQTEIRRLDPNNVEGEGELIRIMAATLDALGRETKVIDSNVMLDIAMDAASNRRFTNASIMNADHSVTVENTTNTFDKANRHASQSTAGNNVLKTYQNNLLKTIRTNGVIDTLYHNQDHQLTDTKSSDGNFSARVFDDAAKLKSFQDKKSRRRQSYYAGTSNLFTIDEHREEKDTNIASRLEGYDSFGAPRSQYTQCDFVDGGKRHGQISNDTFDYAYTDSSQPTATHTTTSLDGRSASATAKQNYDPNYHTNSITGIASADGSGPQSVILESDIEGHPFTKKTTGSQTFTYKHHHDEETLTCAVVKKTELYFQTVTGQPLLSYQVDGNTNAVTSSWQQYYSTNSQGGVATTFKSNASSSNLRTSIDTNPHSTIKNYLNTVPSPETLTSAQSETSYIVQEGDTFASIAVARYADASYASAIADYNSLSASTAPSPQTKLNMPSMEAVHNNSSSYYSYTVFMDSMHTALQPYIVIPAEQIHKKHGSFWKLLTEVIVSTLALAAAPWAAPFLFAFEASTLGAAVATGVTAGLLDAAMQGAACGVGLQDKFSISGVLETGVLGGFLAAAKGAAVANEARQAAATRTMLAMGKASVTSQLMEMSMGLRQKFDVKEVLTSMANGFANAKIEVPNTGQFAGRIVGNAVTTLSGTAITSLVYRQDPNLQTMAAQLLGSTIGSEAGQMLSETTERKAEPETKLPKTQNRQAHVEELAHAELPDGKIDVRDPRWKKQLSDMASDQRQAHHEAQTKGHSYLLDADRQSKYKQMLFGDTLSTSSVSQPNAAHTSSSESGEITKQFGLASVESFSEKSKIYYPKFAAKYSQSYNNAENAFKSVRALEQESKYGLTMAQAIKLNTQEAIGIKSLIASEKFGLYSSALKVAKFGTATSLGAEFALATYKYLNADVKDRPRVAFDEFGKIGAEFFGRTRGAAATESILESIGERVVLIPTGATRVLGAGLLVAGGIAGATAGGLAGGSVFEKYRNTLYEGIEFAVNSAKRYSRNAYEVPDEEYNYYTKGFNQ